MFHIECNHSTITYVCNTKWIFYILLTKFAYRPITTPARQIHVTAPKYIYGLQEIQFLLLIKDVIVKKLNNVIKVLEICILSDEIRIKIDLYYGDKVKLPSTLQASSDIDESMSTPLELSKGEFLWQLIQPY